MTMSCVSAQISSKMANELDQLCKYSGGSKSECIRNAIKEFLERKREDIEDCIDMKKAWKEFEESGEDTVSFEKVFSDIKD